MSRRTVIAALLVGSALAACGVSSPDPAADQQEPERRSAAPASVGAPAPASDAIGGAPTDKEVAALAELLTPPGGIERARIVNGGSTLLRWTTPEPIEAVNAHYDGLADELAFVLIGTGAGGKSWVFEASEAVAASGSVQVAPMADETTITVTLDAEVSE